MAASGSEQRPTDEDRKKYLQAWAKTMIEIWRDKINLLRVHDTYALFRQIEGGVVNPDDAMTVIQHKFLEYGLYQDVGTGRGYKDNNGGQLDFMDPSYREEHRLDRPRKVGPAWGGGYTSGLPRRPREWFSRSYFVSVQVLKEAMARIYAEDFVGLLVDKIQEANHKRSTSLRSRLWGTRPRK